MKDEDDVRGGRDDFRDWRSRASARRSRTGGEGIDKLMERLLSDVVSWFDDGRGRTESGRWASGRQAHRNTRPHEADASVDTGAGGEGERGRSGATGDDLRADANAAESAPSPSMRGKGPRNYRRSDARIAELVNDALLDDERLDATGIEVTVAEGEITLAGHVASRVDKHRAEDLAAHASGVDDVDNRLRVHSESTDSSSHPGGLPGDAEQDADDYGHP